MSGLAQETARAIHRAIRDADHLRGTPARTGGAPGHKEWFHFAVAGDALDVLVNFSLVDDLRADGSLRAVVGRRTLIVRDADGWWGDVRASKGDARETVSGAVALQLDDEGFAYAEGRFTVTAAHAPTDTRVSLTLTPETMPSLVHNVQLGGGPPLHWLMAPRLSAQGEVTHRGRTHVLDGAMAYHDHNWGGFRWGADFAWEWGYALPTEPSNPWTVVFVRMNDRGHRRTRLQGVFVWHEGRQRKVFRDDAVSIHREGRWRGERMVKIPGVMGLLRPGTSNNVPTTWAAEAADGADRISVRFTPDDVCQLIVPDDGDDGVTVIHETVGPLHVEGTIGGASFSWTTRGVVEFLDA